MNIGEKIVRFFKAIIKALTLSAFALSVSAGEVYDLSMTLRVPRVYDNTESLGYRKYQTQYLKGVVYVDENEATVCGLYNRTHRINKENVTYECVVDSWLWGLVGNNKTGKFTKPVVNLSIEAFPSYMEGYEPTDDDTLVLNLAGSSSTVKFVRGYVTGTLGCGCAEYGHVSPTRNYFTCEVVDRAAVWGTFSLKRRSVK